MAIAKPVRFMGALSVVLVFFVIYQYLRPVPTIQPPGVVTGNGDKIENWEQDPLLECMTAAYTFMRYLLMSLTAIGEPPEPLWRHTNQDYTANSPNSARINATLLSLVRNEELHELIPTMKQLEATWNHKFNYPWTFFNDVPFTDEFKEQTQAVTKAKCSYHIIPTEHWEMPSWVSEDLYQESAKILKENDVQYAGMKSYHQMCRWNSGMFYRHPALEHTQYYWRVEPKVSFFCDVDYDVFRYMADHNKTYGFNINLFDSPESIPSLWPETIKFLASHPEYLHQNNAMAWLVDNVRRPDNNIKAHGYSTCHFWSNFEIADLSFWRSQIYEDYFTHLDRTGGFFYERWGDAPVHSIALGLFEDASKIHWYVGLFLYILKASSC